jgi:hypothetical protein
MIISKRKTITKYNYADKIVDHCVVCHSIYRFWFSLWYLQTLLIGVESKNTSSDKTKYINTFYIAGFYTGYTPRLTNLVRSIYSNIMSWRSLFPHFFLCCLFFFDIRIRITPLVSSNSSYWCRKQKYFEKSSDRLQVT